jgi:CheY-like chemotaxis protein
MPDVAHRCAVLFVDDDQDSQELVRLALNADGYDVATAANGRDALVHLRSTADTCIIVLDLTLPQMDGAHFRAAQLRDRSLAWIPVVVISGTVEGAARARELGARAFIPKPVDLDRLRAALRRIGCCQARPRDRQPPDTAQLAGGIRTP